MKLNCVLLIDDDEATNFLHKLVIQRSGYAEEIVAYQNAEEALSYLGTEKSGRYPQPDLIFLDINMPRMNGWEFMDAYAGLSEEQRGKVVVMMLTTSLNPDDKEKANGIENITGFLTKPLTKQMLEGVLEEHFN